MSINHVNGKPFADDAMPVDHPRCCGECYLWCHLSRFNEEKRDTIYNLDQRGHLITDELFVDPARAQLYSHPDFSDLGDAFQLSLRLWRECTFCNQRPGLELVDGVVRADTECPAPEGVLMINEVVFPSGRVVVDDSLRDVFDIRDGDESGFASYNTAYGQAQVVTEYAKHNIAYGPVGNSCPGVYKLDDEHYAIGNYWGSDDEDHGPGERVAGICTDLWAYSMMDYDRYVELGGITEMSWTREVIDVKPGRYRFTHHSGEREFDHDASPITYAHFEWIGEA